MNYCVRKRILDFQFCTGNPPFWNLQNVLSPEGTLRVAEPVWGPFDILSILLCLEKGVGTFKFTGVERPF